MDDALEARLSWFKAVILPYEADVRSRLKRLCPAGFDVDDLVAESLAKAYGAKDIERITAGRSYLFAIARNLLLDAVAAPGDRLPRLRRRPRCPALRASRQKTLS